ncbi:MAG: zinc ribbon domain-containing protein [Rhodocyclaceae bacterium]|nr:zinc ribbon domain-containing protein [Rhodocyclaceae bacterium]
MWIAAWVFFAALVGLVASNRGRSGFWWFLLSLAISPLLGLILVAVMRKIDPNAPKPTTHVRCPDGKEFVLKEARVCKHCNCKLIPESEQSTV